MVGFSYRLLLNRWQPLIWNDQVFTKSAQNRFSFNFVSSLSYISFYFRLRTRIKFYLLLLKMSMESPWGRRFRWWRCPHWWRLGLSKTRLDEFHCFKNWITSHLNTCFLECRSSLIRYVYFTLNVLVWKISFKNHSSYCIFWISYSFLSNIV